MSRHSVKVYLFMIAIKVIFLLPAYSQTSDSRDTISAKNQEEVIYSINTDTSVYQPADTIHWTAKLINVSPDTIQFESVTSLFYEWFLIDTSGTVWDADTLVILDSSIVWTVPPGDTLKNQWYTPIDNVFRAIPTWTYFCILKPWFNYDSISYDTVSFQIEAELSTHDQLFQQIGNFKLGNNFPNPFNTSTNIHFTLIVPSNITIIIYNILGQEMRTLLNEQRSAGVYTIAWDGTSNAGRLAPTGIYLYRLVAASVESDQRFTASRKMVLLK